MNNRRVNLEFSTTGAKSPLFYGGIPVQAAHCEIDGGGMSP